ncbi:hypothetical protein TNCV_3337991 [Trichonephila clavipes]|nr:hypothetical protein TNCV_3337991 [Trichonephila clavipes]
MGRRTLKSIMPTRLLTPSLSSDNKQWPHGHVHRSFHSWLIVKHSGTIDGENAMANAFWVSVRNNISKRWNTTENDVSKNQSSADSAIRLPNTSILNSNAADITECFLAVQNCIILNIL